MKINKILGIYIFFISVIFFLINWKFQIGVYYFLFTELVLILYIFKKEGFFNLFFLSGLIYNSFFTVAYILEKYYNIFDTSSLIFIYEKSYLNCAILNFIFFKVFFNITFLLVYKLKNRKIKFIDFNVKIKPNINKNIEIIFIFLTIIIAAIQLFWGIGIENIEDMVEHGRRFIAKNPIIYSISTPLLFIIFFTSSMFYFNKRLSVITYIFVALVTFIYPFLNSSRSMSSIFATIAILSLIYGKKYKFIIFFTLTVIFLNFSLAKRGGTGFFDYFEEFNIKDAIITNYVTSSNLAVITKTISGLKSGEITPEPLQNVFIYPLYLLPIPSFIFNKEIVMQFGRLTYYFGFPIGITADIISESLMIFGYIGPFFYGIIWGIIIGFVNRLLISERFDKEAKIIILITAIIFLFSSCAYPTRLSSRFMIYFILVYYIYRFYKITKIKFIYN